MIDFRHIVSKRECDGGYLDLEINNTPLTGRLPSGIASLTVLDGLGRSCSGKKPRYSQVWFESTKWFRDNEVMPGTAVLVRFEPSMFSSGNGVVHLTTVGSVHCRSPWRQAEKMPAQKKEVVPEPPAAVPAPTPVSETPVGVNSTTSVEFKHLVSESECRSTYIGLRSVDGNLYGHLLPGPHKRRLAIVDGEGRLTFARKHQGNFLWSGIKGWFRNNAVVPGTLITVRHDPFEEIDGCPVIHITTDISLADEGHGDDGLRSAGQLHASLNTDETTGRQSSGRMVFYSKSGVRFGASRLGMLSARSLRNPAGSKLTAREVYLLAVVAHEMESFLDAVTLLDQALSGDLEVGCQAKALKLREVCRMKAEALVRE